LVDRTCESCGWKLFRLKEEGDQSTEEVFCVNRRCKEGRKYWKKSGKGNEKLESGRKKLLQAQKQAQR
ncbi:MAG: hypothetical protein ACOX7X_09490, partial [Methanosarcina flavescens]